MTKLILYLVDLDKVPCIVSRRYSFDVHYMLSNCSKYTQYTKSMLKIVKVVTVKVNIVVKGGRDHK